MPLHRSEISHTALNPECQAGKHPNCDGLAWDTEADEIARCACSCHRLST